MFFFFKQKTAYEMRISDWSSDVCFSDLQIDLGHGMGRLPESRTVVAMQHVPESRKYKPPARACAGYRMTREKGAWPQVQVPAASSPRACRNTSRLPQIASPAMIAATARSGQLRPVPNTPSAAPIKIGRAHV